MDAVTLTFPGHFFQTLLSIKSIHKHYTDIKTHYVLVDDVNSGCWTDYLQDLQQALPNHDFIFKTVSSLDRIALCQSGWWRQQLVKMTLDEILPGDEWFVVDGDVIFDTFCEYRDVVPLDHTPLNESGSIEPLTVNYVKNLLGIDQGHLYLKNRPCLTSPIPYRLLSRNLLEKLRYHVETRFGKKFVELHLEWFNNETIVRTHSDLSKMSMSEWELIELFRREVLQESLPFHCIGPGYQLDVDTSSMTQHKGIYRHGYRRDAQMPKEWFQKQGLDVSDRTWAKAVEWLRTQEPWQTIEPTQE